MLIRWAKFGAIGNTPIVWPRITKNGLPGGCGIPSTYAAAMYSLVSHIAVDGESVIRYKMNTSAAAIAAMPYDGRSSTSGAVPARRAARLPEAG